MEVWQQNRERVGLGGVLDADDEGSDDTENMRPRKRAKLETDGVVVGSPEQLQEPHIPQQKIETEDAYTKLPGQILEFPPRNTTIPERGPRKKASNDPARKSTGINPPAMATRLPPPKVVADFSPWTGLHPEDILNEQVIKTGYFDKPPGPSQNESNSARQSIWPNLSQKNNIALQTLSHLFTQVLDKRQGLAKCTAPSTFKPPPRVTVTDTKREAWLKDLANTNIPLRRQSRTIPHGIRGKLLMEQCLAKSIPLQRAVWLAKCVGANELRSFRRKGVSGSAAAQGETKWVRDWTVQVEQFLESVADACGQENWRTKIDYAIKLVSAFYSENLLDKDEYLDWLVRTFTSAPLNKLPLWIIIVQIYWRDLTTIGRRGRKLASAILEHLYVLAEKRNPALEPLKTRLQKLITVLATSANGCLVLPNVWEKYKRMLSSEELQTSSQELQQTLATVAKRNELLSAPIERTAETTRSPVLALYTMLDGVDLDVDMITLPGRCLDLVPNVYELVRAILHWCSTLYRRGDVRIYISAKIIAHLHNTGHDTDGAVLAYLQQHNSGFHPEAKQVWSVVGELVFHDCFATGAYLQWLIASGVIFSSDKSSLATGLLSSLPVHQMPQRLRNLRKTLLARLETADDEELSVNNAKLNIEQALATSCMQYADDDGVMACHSGSAKLMIGHWICERAADLASNSAMSLSAFGVMRSVLEIFGDLPAVSSLIEAALCTEDTQLLATIADTLSMHALGFTILGSFDRALDRLMKQHKALRSHSLDRAFLLAHIALLERSPDRFKDTQLLCSDLAVHEQQHSAAVCSPASDNLVGMQAGTLDNDAEIDAVFASGNSMDEQTMQRVFLRVIEHAGKPYADVAEPESKIYNWLNQLRGVDGAGFEKLAKDYVSATILRSQTDITATSGVVALVASRCLGLDSVTAVGNQAAPKAAAAMLSLMAAPLPHANLSTSEAYAFVLQQQRFCREHSDDVVSLLRKAAEDPAFSFDTDWVLDLVLRTITGHPGKLRKSFTENQPSQNVQQAASRICKGLLSQGQVEAAASDLNASQIISSANALNAPFSVGWLRFYTTSQAVATAGEEEAMKSAMLKAVADKSEVWPQLLSAAKTETLKEIHVWARSSIMAEISTAQDIRPADDHDASEQLCQVLDVTSDAVKGEDDTHVLSLLTDKIKAQEKLLGDMDASDSDYQSKVAVVTRRISTLMHLSTLPARNEATNDNAKQARPQLVAALCSLLSHPHLIMQQQIADHIHDVAALHADALSEETISTLARQTVLTNPRVFSLLGSSNMSSSATPSLAVASRAQPAQTQQQRALARRQPQVQQGGATSARPANAERKLTPFPLRNWEIMSDPTPVMGENDCAISLGLFGARRAT